MYIDIRRECEFVLRPNLIQEAECNNVYGIDTRTHLLDIV